MELSEQQRAVILAECAAGAAGDAERRQRWTRMQRDLSPVDRRDVQNAETVFRGELDRAARDALGRLIAHLPDTEHGTAGKVWAIAQVGQPAPILTVRCPEGDRLGAVWRTPSDGPLYVGLGRQFDGGIHSLIVHEAQGRDVFPDLLELRPGDARHGLLEGGCRHGYARINDRDGIRAATRERLKGHRKDPSYVLDSDRVSYAKGSARRR